MAETALFAQYGKKFYYLDEPTDEIARHGRIPDACLIIDNKDIYLGYGWLSNENAPDIHRNNVNKFNPDWKCFVVLAPIGRIYAKAICGSIRQ